MNRVITFHRHRYAPRAILYDELLDLRSIEELRAWAAKEVNIVVIDSETGEDVSRVLLA